MHQFLLEIFSEEIPATMQLNAIKQLHDGFNNKLQELWPLELKNIDIVTYITPQRMVLIAHNIPQFAEIHKEARGPRLNAPTEALEGFCKKYNVTPQELKQKDDFYFFSSYQAIKAKEILAIIVENILETFSWPKSMKWNKYATLWIRPIHSILCLLNEEVIEVSYGHIQANRYTYGHRFMSPPMLTIDHVSHYLPNIAKVFVILSSEERERLIRKQIKEQLDLIGERDLSLIEDNSLMDEVVGLIEYPKVFLGRIEQEFMQLPPEVLITALKVHQKYLMLQNKEGRLAPYFVITANIEPKDGGKALVAGNEKVLKARLSDAMFFMQQDKIISLDNMIERLSRVAFHSQLGSLFEKVERMKIIAHDIAVQLQQDINHPTLSQLAIRAASLCKADIVSEMVKEFPELQGIMGYYYALAQKEDEQIALAIKDHYKPMGPNDTLPLNLVGAIVSLADKLDTLQQMFAIHIKPTGSKDPYALRRAALGIIRIICGYQLKISLRSLPCSISPEVQTEVLEFIKERVSHFDKETYNLTFIKNAI